MTTYNTGNPVPSAQAKDRYDNSQTFDEVINGTFTYYVNRVGANVMSLKGMETLFNAAQLARANEYAADKEYRDETYDADKLARDTEFAGDQADRVEEFNDFLESSGFETPVDYVAGLSITRPTQVVRFSGELYRAHDADIPFTTTVWATDSAKFFSMGDAALRQDLTKPEGAQMVGFNVIDGIPRTIYLKVAEIRTDTNYGASNDNVAHTLTSEGFASLAAAQVFWPLAQSLNDSLDLLAAEQALKKLREDYSGRPKYLELPPGKGRQFNRALVGNPLLDCNNPVENLTIIGFPGHRAYDTGNDSPTSIAGYGTFDTLFDFRAMRKCRMEGVGVHAPTTINRVFHLGARGCLNPKQMSRVFSFEKVVSYGGQIAMDTYLTSGLFISGGAYQRGALRGLVIDAGGDWEIAEVLFNNHGPMISAGGIAAANEFDGACILILGGGGHGQVRGGKFETSNKGIIIHNAHDILVDGTTIDKMGEYAWRVSTDQNTVGKTVLGYQPRGIKFANLTQISAGWIGSTYNCFGIIRNDGTNAEISVSVDNCDAFWAGDIAIPGDPTVSGSPWGVGPTRSGIRAIIAGGGGNEIHVTKNGGDWSNPVAPTSIAPSPGTKYLFESYQAGVTFENIGQDRMGLPSITSSGVQIGTTLEVKGTLTGVASGFPASVAAGATATSNTFAVVGAALTDGLRLDPPGSLAGFIAQPSMSSSGVAVIRLYNPTGSPINVPAGDWVVRRPAR